MSNLFRVTTKPARVNLPKEILYDWLKQLYNRNIYSWLKYFSGGKFVTISHNDLDGYGCSEYIRNHFRTNDYFCMVQNRVFNVGYGFDYSGISDLLEECDMIFITDLSLKQEQISYLESFGKPILWIDHHPTSGNVEICNKTIRVLYSEIGVSAALMTCIIFTMINTIKLSLDMDPVTNELCFNNLEQKLNNSSMYEIPLVIKEISLWDTFHPCASKKFMYGMTAFPLDDVERWKNLFKIMDLSEIETIGGYIENYLHTKWNFINQVDLKEVSLIIDGKQYSVAILNSNISSSLQFMEHYNECDGVIRFNINKNGIWNYSAYADANNPNHLPCMELAMHYGGGGHKCAAGWKSEKLIEELFIDGAEINTKSE